MFTVWFTVSFKIRVLNVPDALVSHHVMQVHSQSKYSLIRCRLPQATFWTSCKTNFIMDFMCTASLMVCGHRCRLCGVLWRDCVLYKYSFELNRICLVDVYAEIYSLHTAAGCDRIPFHLRRRTSSACC